MDPDAAKADLHHYLRRAREALVWKLDGLSEYDVRRPMTRTGTNLLGLIKHAASVEAGYLGETFGRPFDGPMPWLEDDDPQADLWATPDESREQLIGLYRQVWAHGDATIDALDLDAPGRVLWWGEHGQVTLHRVLVHLIAELDRHAGHADIIRELIDGAAGVREGGTNLPDEGDEWWTAYRQRVEEAARRAAGRDS